MQTEVVFCSLSLLFGDVLVAVAVAVVVCFSFLLIKGREVQLPIKWQAFLALGDNKVDVTCFLSDTLTTQAPADTTIIVSDGCLIEGDVLYSDSSLDVACVRSNYGQMFVLNEVSLNSHVDNKVVSP